MADSRVTLKGLVQSLVGAIASAQDAIEYQQIRKIMEHVKDGRPEMMQLRLPSMRSEASLDAEDVYRIPLLALMPHTALKIEEASMDFQVSLGDMSDRHSRSEGGNGQNIASGLDSEIQIDHRLTGRETSNSVRLSVKIKSLDPSEGTLKLIGQLVQTQGICTGEAERRN